MDSRRILVTGLSTYWGGRLAQALEAFPEVEAVIGVDNEEPSVELERTEYVKVGAQHALLRRVVEAAEIDTVVDTRLVVDSNTTSSSKAHENNVIGTMNILAACSGPDSPVRKVVFKSSTHYYGCEQDDPAFFDETMRRPHPPRTGDRARHRRGGGLARTSSPSATRRRRSRCCASRTCSARTCAPRTSTCSRCPRCR